MAASLPLQNRLLRDLECPVCIEPMVEKIVQCADGHNICKECKDKVHDLLSQIQGGLFMKRVDMELGENKCLNSPMSFTSHLYLILQTFLKTMIPLYHS